MSGSRLVLLSLVWLFAMLPVSAQERSFTTEEVLAACEAGQYRVIETHGRPYDSTADGMYIAVMDDGVYRVSDGVRVLALDMPRFSPDGNYVYQAAWGAVQPVDGIYRLSDGQHLIAFNQDESDVTPEMGAGYVMVGFSKNGEYAAVAEDGVYRLSDGTQVLDTGQPIIAFSPDSTLAATGDGVYRLSDGQRILVLDGTYGEFSPDGAYVYASNGGLYRLSDGEKLIEGVYGRLDFSPDMTYAAIEGFGVYRLSDGQRQFTIDVYAPHFTSDSRYMLVSTTYDRLYRLSDGELVFEADDILMSPNEQVIAVNRDGVYRLSDMLRLFELRRNTSPLMSFSPDSAHLVVSGDGIYRLADGQKVYYANMPYGDDFSPDGAFLAVDDEGVYRLADGEKLFDIDGQAIRFTPDGAAAITVFENQPIIYRVRDGRKFEGLKLLNAAAGLLAIDTQVLVIDRTVLRR